MSIFDKISLKKPRGSVFDLGHEVKMSCNFGELIPIMCNEVVPGDVFNHSSEIQLRFAPLLAPIMHRVNVYTHFFFVPNRLVWDSWEDFMTGGKHGNLQPLMPYFKLWNMEYKNYPLMDYFGIPEWIIPTDKEGLKINALPFRAYNLIFNEYYRDQNLQDEAVVGTSSGYEDVQNYRSIKKRCWEKDYFTSALPWPQRGDDVHISMGDIAPVVPGGDGKPRFNNSEFPSAGLAGSARWAGSRLLSDESGNIAEWNEETGLVADLANAKGATVNDLRKATRLQTWLEKNARAGSRYIEQILAHFGVRSSDARLQRPEYLGGGKAPVVISDVPQTSQSTETSAQATLAGNAQSYSNTHSWRKRFEEHGYVIGIMSVLPRTAYQQGIPKHFLKEDRFDYYFPEFAHLGEQPILKKELYVSEDPEYNNEVFGYTPRYAEYKYQSSRVCGDFKKSLNFWHLGRIFEDKPELNSDFVSCNDEALQRIFAVTDDKEDKIWVQLYNNTRAFRLMPYHSTPQL